MGGKYHFLGDDVPKKLNAMDFGQELDLELISVPDSAICRAIKFIFGWKETMNNGGVTIVHGSAEDEEKKYDVEIKIHANHATYNSVFMAEALKPI